MIRTALAVFASVALAGAAHAGDVQASLAAVKGEILVSGGGGLSAGTAGAALKPGDRVIARSGGATIEFADGCRQSLKAGAMATIAAKSPCVGGPGVVTAGVTSAQLGFPDWPPGAYVAGVGSIVLLGAIIYGLTDPLEDPVSN